MRLLEFVLVTFFSCSCISEFSTLWGCFLLQIGKWNRKGRNTDVQQKFLVSCCREKQRPRGAHGLCACRLLSGSRSVSTVGVLTSHWDQQWLKAVCKEVYCWLVDMLCNSDKTQNASDWQAHLWNDGFINSTAHWLLKAQGSEAAPLVCCRNDGGTGQGATFLLHVEGWHPRVYSLF